MTRFCKYSATLAALGLCLAAAASASDLTKGALFSSDEALTVEIAAPWRQLIRTEEEQRWPATLMVENPAGEPLEVSLTVERRGISRQKICDFPPIRLRFDKDSVEDTLFDGEGSLKLVSHCDKGVRWTQYYVREMLAYRIYNQVTDFSFRVRPLQVRYRDVDQSREAESHFAFVLEDIDELADRHDMKELEPESSHPARLDPEVASLVALFQFMIGNLDWSPTRGPDGSCCHNVKLIGAGSESDTEYPIPYDFDATGLVDAHYAQPPAGLRVRNVRTRLFRGYCRHNETLEAARARFLQREADILALVEGEPRLTERNRNFATRYLESFFDILRDDAAFEKQIVSACRG